MNIIKEKQKKLDELYNSYKNKKLCMAYCTPETNMVFGQGNPNAKVIFIGEAPGKEEDIQSLPFVGRSGQLLRKNIEKSGLKPEDIYITNIVKCRPTNNKTPDLSKIDKNTLELLHKQIKIIEPKILVTVGSISSQIILQDKNIKITKMHGKIFPKDKLIIIPVYHPAYILRNFNKEPEWIEDLKLIKASL